MRQGRLVLYTLVLGVTGALAARLFALMLNFSQDVLLARLAGYQMPVLTGKGALLAERVGPHGLWLVPLALVIGGLAAGILVYALAPEAEGHGTDTVVDSYHQRGGFLRARLPPLKMVASAITIGSGGSAGREGPTALINAGMASVFATWTRHSDGERRLMVLIGMAAGLSAIFRSPVPLASPSPRCSWSPR